MISSSYSMLQYCGLTQEALMETSQIHFTLLLNYFSIIWSKKKTREMAKRLKPVFELRSQVNCSNCSSQAEAQKLPQIQILHLFFFGFSIKYVDLKYYFFSPSGSIHGWVHHRQLRVWGGHWAWTQGLQVVLLPGCHRLLSWTVTLIKKCIFQTNWNRMRQQISLNEREWTV